MSFRPFALYGIEKICYRCTVFLTFLENTMKLKYVTTVMFSIAPLLLSANQAIATEEKIPYDLKVEHENIYASALDSSEDEEDEEEESLEDLQK
jgi:hypothetical protein